MLDSLHYLLATANIKNTHYVLLLSPAFTPSRNALAIEREAKLLDSVPRVDGLHDPLATDNIKNTLKMATIPRVLSEDKQNEDIHRAP